jgi:hypothetical protein
MGKPWRQILDAAANIQKECPATKGVGKAAD